MTNVINYLTFIPFILYYITFLLNILKEIKHCERRNKKIELKNIFYLDYIILILIFIYFLKYDNATVDKMLFFFITLYMFINSLYYKRSKNKLNPTKYDKWIIFLSLLIGFMPILHYIIFGNLSITYLSLLLMAFFLYFIVKLCMFFIIKIRSSRV